MNKKLIRNYQIFSIIFTFILGTLLHFTYKWSGENQYVAWLSSINESVWEHLKLAYFPMMLTVIFGYFFVGKKVSNFLCSKIIGIIIALVFMVTFFFTYTGILGKNIPVIDIASFYVAVVLGEYVAYRLMVSMFKCNYKIALVILVVLGFSFIYFTYNTPNIGIFKDPITGKYGL